MRLTGEGETGDGLATDGATNAGATDAGPTTTGSGAGVEIRRDAFGIGVASELSRGRWPGLGKGVLKGLVDARGSGVGGRDSC